MLDAIGAGLTPRVGNRDWADVWRDSPEFKETIEEIERIKANGLKKPAEEKSNVSRYSTPFLFQMKTVAERSFVTCGGHRTTSTLACSSTSPSRSSSP
jgi:ATP-binding cassette subfamily G (WHITE) protein 2 (SNQ2)